MDTRNKIFAVVGTVAIVAAAGITGLLLFVPQNTGSNTPATNLVSSQNTTSSSTASSSVEMTATGSYKDGTYTASVSYDVPHGETNALKATVVIASGKISSVVTNSDYRDHESGQYIGRFEASVDGSAIGQSIGSYGPSRIGGASLTTSAFREAIIDVRSQAKG